MYIETKARARKDSMITVQYTPSEWLYNMKTGEVECEHLNTTPDEIEHYDHYQEAVTGIPQPLSYELIENCDQCTAYYSTWDEEWHDGGEV